MGKQADYHHAASPLAFFYLSIRECSMFCIIMVVIIVNTFCYIFTGRVIKADEYPVQPLDDGSGQISSSNSNYSIPKRKIFYVILITKLISVSNSI